MRLWKRPIKFNLFGTEISSGDISIFLAIVFALCVIAWIRLAEGEELIVYFCPKCKSENIEITCDYIPPKPEVVRKSIDKLEDDHGIRISHPVVHWYPYTAKCLDCGYKKEFYRTWYIEETLD